MLSGQTSETENGKLYTGITTDVEERVKAHSDGLGAKFTRGKGPFSVAYTRVVGSRSMASKLEYRIKKLRRAEKERLIKGELDVEQLIVNL